MWPGAWPHIADFAHLQENRAFGKGSVRVWPLPLHRACKRVLPHFRHRVGDTGMIYRIAILAEF
jgi:hypothetical protein